MGHCFKGFPVSLLKHLIQTDLKHIYITQNALQVLNNNKLAQRLY